MVNFYQYRTLTSYEKSIIPEAFFQLSIARIRVSLFPSHKYLPKSSQLTSPVFISNEKINKIRTIANVVNGLSTRTPWLSTCLVKVIALHKMLSKRGIQHTIHIGIKKNMSKELNAHAWLSVSSEIVTGGENLDNFKEIMRIVI
jgi:ubiquitin C-terminal hydrolase